MKTGCQSSFKKYELYEYNQRNNVIGSEMYTQERRCDSDILIRLISRFWETKLC